MIAVKQSVVASVVFSFLVTGFIADAMAQDSPWLVRLRAIAMVPDESSTVTVIGGNIDLTNDYVPEIDITYFIKPNIAVELILATTTHDGKDKGSTLGTVDLGEVSLLPPILTLQYHFMPDAKFRPYAGAGINYTIFYDAKAPGGTVTSVEYENSFGFALQAGIDIELGFDDRWAVNFDVKKVFLETDAKLNNGAILADLEIDPWVFGLGLAYRF